MRNSFSVTRVWPRAILPPQPLTILHQKIHLQINPSEITITAIQDSTDPSSNPSSLPSINPSVAVTPALVTLSGCTNPLFPTNEEFKKAVKEYISQECSTNSGCAIGQTYGYPIGKWLTTCITDMSHLFAGSEEHIPVHVLNEVYSTRISQNGMSAQY
jgi:hypothetical protein